MTETEMGEGRGAEAKQEVKVFGVLAMSYARFLSFKLDVFISKILNLYMWILSLIPLSLFQDYMK